MRFARNAQFLGDLRLGNTFAAAKIGFFGEFLARNGHTNPPITNCAELALWPRHPWSWFLGNGARSDQSVLATAQHFPSRPEIVLVWCALLAVDCSSSPNPSCLLPMNPVRTSDYTGIFARIARVFGASLTRLQLKSPPLPPQAPCRFSELVRHSASAAS